MTNTSKRIGLIISVLAISTVLFVSLMSVFVTEKPLVTTKEFYEVYQTSNFTIANWTTITTVELWDKTTTRTSEEVYRNASTTDVLKYVMRGFSGEIHLISGPYYLD